MFIVLLQGVQHDQKLRGSLLVIVCCLVVEFGNFNQKEYLLFETGLPSRLSVISLHSDLSSVPTKHTNIILLHSLLFNLISLVPRLS